MKRKFLTLFAVIGLLCSFAVSASAADYDVPNYLELPNGTRIMSESRLNWGTHKIYVVPVSNGIRICCTETLYLVDSSGNYNSFIGSSYGNCVIAGTTFQYDEFKFPFTLGGTTYKSMSDFETKCKGDTVLRLYEDSASVDDATYFFKNPLLEEVKVQQGKTTEITYRLASLVRFLIPFGVGCLALLMVLPVLPRVFWIFLR